jgi:hypothetical protein
MAVMTVCTESSVAHIRRRGKVLGLKPFWGLMRLNTADYGLAL